MTGMLKMIHVILSAEQAQLPLEFTLFLKKICKLIDTTA